MLIKEECITRSFKKSNFKKLKTMGREMRFHLHQMSL